MFAIRVRDRAELWHVNEMRTKRPKCYHNPAFRERSAICAGFHRLNYEKFARDLWKWTRAKVSEYKPTAKL